jgi:hypothetical protein
MADTISREHYLANKRTVFLYYHALDIVLLVAVVSLAVFVFRLLNFSVHTQINTYIEAANNAAKSSDHAPAHVLTFTRAMDSAIVKSTVVFMGFMVTLLGALYVLRAATASFSLDVKSDAASGTLQSSSPGLVMVVLGIVAVGLALYSKVNLTIEEGHGQSTGQSETPPTPSIVAPVSSSGNDSKALSEDEQTRRNASVVVTAKTGGVIVELPPFPAGSAALSTQQKELLQETAFTVRKRSIFPSGQTDTCLRLVG